MAKILVRKRTDVSLKIFGFFSVLFWPLQLSCVLCCATDLSRFCRVCCVQCVCVHGFFFFLFARFSISFVGCCLLLLYSFSSWSSFVPMRMRITCSIRIYCCVCARVCICILYWLLPHHHHQQHLIRCRVRVRVRVFDWIQFASI